MYACMTFSGPVSSVTKEVWLKQLGMLGILQQSPNTRKLDLRVSDRAIPREEG